MPQIKYICLLAILCLNAACSRHALHDAQTVVAQADSLWHAGQMYGIDQGDSSTLAQAYETLGTIPLPFREGLGLGFSYAHACYHYGRLLRKKDDPVSAMQVFINATHSHTRDYHILGRIYSNMGDLCHLAGDFPLSYDMFEKSGEMYLRNGDTLLYYYLLNDMALELAEQGKKDSTLRLIHEIEKQCTDRDVLNKTTETKARLYIKTAQFDSTLWYTNTLLSLGYDQSFGLVSRAQAFDTLGVIDSALYYANIVLSLPTAAIHDKYNMLYITSHYDTTLANNEILDITSQRADIGMTIDHLHAQHARASEILRFELTKRLNLQGVFILITLILLGVIVFLIPLLVKKHKQNISTLIDKQTTYTIKSIKKHIDSTNLNSTLHWKEYNSMKVEADLYMNGLVSKLESYHLNETEIRFCILTLLDFPLKQIAEKIYYSYPSAIKTLKKRIAVKLGTTPPELKDFLLHLQ